MFRIEGATIHCSRGDEGTITLKIPITDSKGNIKYKDESEDIYWYNTKSKILYDSSYIETKVSVDTLMMVLYIFQPGDKITFNIYNKNGYNKEPLMSKQVKATKITDNIYISLDEKETTFFNPINKPTIFWYDITLNDYLTVICYNEDGAKEFILYPANGNQELQDFQGIEEQEPEEDDDAFDGIEIIDNLKSTSIFAVLSANQGRVLKEEIDNSGIVVSATEPTENRKKVWIQKGKNLYRESLIIRLVNCININGTIKQSEADTNSNLNWKVQMFKDGQFISTPVTLSKSDIGKFSLTFTKYSNFNEIGFGLNGSEKDTLVILDASELIDVKTYTISFNILNTTQGSISWDNIQLEQNAEATDHEEYIPFRIYIKNNNDVYEEFVNVSNIEGRTTALEQSWYKYKGATDVTDNFNYLLNSGMYLYNGINIANQPPNFGTVEVIHTDSYIVQRCSGANDIAQRISYDNGSSWTDWKMVTLT